MLMSNRIRSGGSRRAAWSASLPLGTGRALYPRSLSIPDSTWRLVGASSTTRMLAGPATDFAWPVRPDTTPAAAANETGALEATPFRQPASIPDFSSFMEGSLQERKNLAQVLPGRVDQGASGIRSVRPG